MVLYLTGSFIPYQEIDSYEKKDPGECYGFFEDLKQEWPESANILYVPCDPKADRENDHQKRCLLDAFEMKDLKVSELRMLTDKDKKTLPELVSWADVIYLSGGHAPDQLAFMKRLGLKEALLSYEGIVIGLSAGSMNAAYNVYLVPELQGEAADPNYVRFSEGLDLTNIELIPHSEYLKTVTLDGKDLINDVVIPDSFGSRFYMITDGSYFKVKNGKTIFRGVGELIEDGKITPLKPGTIIPLMGVYEQPVIKTILEDVYDLVVSVNINTNVCEVYHVSEEFKEVFESGRLKYNDISFRLSQLLWEEEQSYFLSNVALSNVTKEMEEKGNFVRTVHIETPSGRQAKILRVRKVPGYPDWLLFLFFDITTALDHDWLTDEYARTGFVERGKLFLKERPKDSHFSLVYTNVKGFKVVNELFGDKNGDLVIYQTRDVIRKYLKPIILARLESDHFVLITSDEHLTPDNLRTMSRQSFKTDSKEFNYEISCGIYSIKNKKLEITQLIDGAKLAEKSIASGKSDLFAYYDDAIKDNYLRQMTLLADFEKSIKAKEFEPYYQPVVDARTGEIVSAEVLVRWPHKGLGMVPPSDFIPVLESEGKISILDKYMLERVMKLVLRCARNEKKAVPCAINLSRIDFYDTAFIESIFKKIKELKIDTSLIRFEVTESAYADLETKAIDYLSEMKKQGIKILLDDYGSGMSSLSMLESFSFDIIKLDMGFIRKIGKNSKVESIIITTIGLAHMIGAKVTAEGVETELQYKFLKSYDCDYIQGYYFHKPVPEAEFEKMLG